MSTSIFAKPYPVFLFALLLNSLLWLLTKQLFPVEENIALHYNTTIGIDFIGESSQIMTLPLIGLIIIIFNIALGIFLKRTDNQTAWTFWGIIPVIQIILIGALYLIWQVNQ